MNIHEYQAKGLLAKYGVSILRGGVAYTADEAEHVARELGCARWVVKAQIHAGGRGKGGGVKFADSTNDVRRAAHEILSKVLITPQTGPAGKAVKRVYVEEGCDVRRELYFSILVDRASGFVTAMASGKGGMAIEDVAAETPEETLKVAIDPISGMQPFHARKIAFGIGLKDDAQVNAAVGFMRGVYQALIGCDASLIEVNPLVVTGESALVALDAKMIFDDNALFRHKDVAEMRDEAEEDQREIEAAKHELSYVKLDGNIGCMVNGAGLAMATMDIIKLYGAEPANFLDVGGGATRERVSAAFKIILSDPSVEGILVNIFGGIMRCDVIAEGVIAAARELDVNVPLVVRLEGTNVDLGKKILDQSGLAIVSANNLADAAEKVVKAVQDAS